LAAALEPADLQEGGGDVVAGDGAQVRCGICEHQEHGRDHKDHGAEDGFDRERAKEGVERRLSAGFVEAVQSRS